MFKMLHFIAVLHHFQIFNSSLNGTLICYASLTACSVQFVTLLAISVHSKLIKESLTSSLCHVTDIAAVEIFRHHVHPLLTVENVLVSL
jgi:hypothetical protein